MNNRGEAKRILLQLKGLKGINIETNDRFYPMREEVSVEHVLDRMGYGEEDEEVEI